MKFCKDCKHFMEVKPSWLDRVIHNEETIYRCAAGAYTVRDLNVVTGEPADLCTQCDSQRERHTWPCGPDAKLWEAR